MEGSSEAENTKGFGNESRVCPNFFTAESLETTLCISLERLQERFNNMLKENNLLLLLCAASYEEIMRRVKYPESPEFQAPPGLSKAVKLRFRHKAKHAKNFTLKNNMLYRVDKCRWAVSDKMALQVILDAHRATGGAGEYAVRQKIRSECHGITKYHVWWYFHNGVAFQEEPLSAAIAPRVVEDIELGKVGSTSTRDESDSENDVPLTARKIDVVEDIQLLTSNITSFGNTGASPGRVTLPTAAESGDIRDTTLSAQNIVPRIVKNKPSMKNVVSTLEATKPALKSPFTNVGILSIQSMPEEATRVIASDVAVHDRRTVLTSAFISSALPVRLIPVDTSNLPCSEGAISERQILGHSGGASCLEGAMLDRPILVHSSGDSFLEGTMPNRSIYVYSCDSSPLKGTATSTHSGVMVPEGVLLPQLSPSSISECPKRNALLGASRLDCYSAELRKLPNFEAVIPVGWSGTSRSVVLHRLHTLDLPSLSLSGSRPLESEPRYPTLNVLMLGQSLPPSSESTSSRYHTPPTREERPMKRGPSLEDLL